jgi:Enolase C-terminal domain-like
MRDAPRKPEAMVARVRAVREAIGPDIGLMVDANQQLSMSEAIHLGRALEPFSLTWFEEPVICHNHEGEAAVAATLDTPIASGGHGAHPPRYSAHVAGSRRGHPHAGCSGWAVLPSSSKPARCARLSTRQYRHISSLK